MPHGRSIATELACLQIVSRSSANRRLTHHPGVAHRMNGSEELADGVGVTVARRVPIDDKREIYPVTQKNISLAIDWAWKFGQSALPLFA